MIPALILAGGLGTRLAQTVPHLPKALAPICETPFLHLLLRQLQRTGIISKIILALGHKASLIESTELPSGFSLPLEMSLESTPLGTGGAILNAMNKIDTDLFFAMNGDSFFDLSFGAFLNFHQSHQAALSIACTEVADTARYGSLKIDSSGRILHFGEKSSNVYSSWINAGIYLMEKKLFSNIPFAPYSLEKDLFPRFLKKRIFAFAHQGVFIDIGTQHDYYEAQKTLKPWL